MLPWEQRPIEIAHLHNPALCTLLICQTIEGYKEQKQQAMPYSLVFFTLPLILHKPTRQAFPNSLKTRMFTWLGKAPEHKIGFAERTRYYVPFTKEAILFGSRMSVISVTDIGDLECRSTGLKTSETEFLEEISEYKAKAHFLGRWIASAGSEATIYKMWGIRP